MNAKRVIAAALLLGQVGCMTGPKRVNDMSPQDYLSLNQPKELWGTLNDGEQIFVGGPRVIADTVFGWSADGSEELAIPVADFKEVKVRKLSIFKTAIIPALLLGGVIAAYVSTSSTASGLADEDSTQIGERRQDIQ